MTDLELALLRLEHDELNARGIGETIPRLGELRDILRGTRFEPWSAKALSTDEVRLYKEALETGLPAEGFLGVIR